jgi:hypothetical protein
MLGLQGLLALRGCRERTWWLEELKRVCDGLVVLPRLVDAANVVIWTDPLQVPWVLCHPYQRRRARAQFRRVSSRVDDSCRFRRIDHPIAQSISNYDVGDHL